LLSLAFSLLCFAVQETFGVQRTFFAVVVLILELEKPIIMGTNPKTTLYVGGLEENVTEGVLHAAFIPFGDIKDVSMPLDQSTQKHRGFAFVTYIDKEDAAAAMDNMHNAELYGRVLTVNYAQPIKIKGGEQGWASQPVWADADTWFERQQQEEGLQRLQAEHQATIEAAEAEDRKKLTEARDGETEAVDDEPTDPMAQAEAEALSNNPPQ
jgi:peptidyl-prolyl isomerase E (cyclophilin E)